MTKLAGLWVAVLVLFLAAPPVAHAGDDDAIAIQRAESLNKRAMEDYDLLEFEGAKASLNEALSVLRKAGLEQHPAAARANLNLGVVYVAGFKDRYKGFQHFVKALQIAPELELDPGVATPELKEVFQNARESIGARPGAPRADSAGDVRGLVHQPIDDAVGGAAIAVKAQAGRDLRAAKLLLYYRPQGKEDFSQVPMVRGQGGVYTAEIPGTDVLGKSLQYYLEVKDAGGKTVASSGTSASPNIISIAQGGAKALPADTEDPLATKKAAEKPDGEGGGQKSWWLSVGIGAGAGFASGESEVARVQSRAVPINTGLAPTLLHVAPEVGFFLTEAWALALQGRFQLLSGSDQKGAATGAVAVLLRALYFTKPTGFRPYVGFAAGGGEIRHRVDLTGAVPADQPKFDNALSGPAFFGPTAGFAVDLGPTLAFMLDVNALVGAPKFTANLDVNVGLGFAF